MFYGPFTRTRSQPRFVHQSGFYKKNYFHMDPGCLLSQAYSPDPGCLLSRAYSPDLGWLLCEADSFNVGLLLIFTLAVRHRVEVSAPVLRLCVAINCACVIIQDQFEPRSEFCLPKTRWRLDKILHYLSIMNVLKTSISLHSNRTVSWFSSCSFIESWLSRLPNFGIVVYN